MKTRQTIVRLMMALAVMFSVQLTASAQLGKLKGLADKAKSQVDKNKNKVSNATSKVTDVTDKASADQFAADQETRLNNGTPASEVNWRWEDKKAEYYPTMHWQGAKTEAFAEQLLDLYKGLFDVFIQNDFYAGSAYWLNYIPLKGTDKYVPSNEYLCYAWTKNFVDNPTWENFLYFCYVLPFRDFQFGGRFNYGLEDGAKGIISNEKKMYLPWKDMTQMMDEKYKREIYALELAAKKMPLDKVCQRAVTLANAAVNSYKKQEMNEGQLWNMFQAIAIWKTLVPKMADSSNDLVRNLESDMNSYGNLVAAWGLHMQMVNLYRLCKLGIPKGVLPSTEKIWKDDLKRGVGSFVVNDGIASKNERQYEMVAYAIDSEDWKQTSRIFSKEQESRRIKFKEPKNEEIPVRIVCQDLKNNGKLTYFTGYLLRHGLAPGTNEMHRSSDYLFVPVKQEPIEYK